MTFRIQAPSTTIFSTRLIAFHQSMRFDQLVEAEGRTGDDVQMLRFDELQLAIEIGLIEV